MNLMRVDLGLAGNRLGQTSISSVLWGCGLAILSAGVALAITGSLRNPVFPTPLFFASIVISTWYGGGIPGLLAVILATVALDYDFISPAGTLTFNKPDMPYLFEFAMPALLTCWFVKKRRTAETGLRRSRDELQTRMEERQSQLAHVTRMLTVGELGVSVAHEINQPLMAVVLNADTCLRWLDANPPNLDEAREAARRIIDDGTRGGEIVRRIRTLSKKTAPSSEPVNLNEIIGDAIALLDRDLTRHRISLKTTLAKDLPAVLGDRVQLQQVIFNLSINAVEAMSANTKRPRELLLRSETETPADITITVEDSGPGLSTEDPEQPFTAFYSTKPEGMGMGLSISRTIIEAHGGRLWASSSPSGAVFRFRLPALPTNHP